MVASKMRTRSATSAAIVKVALVHQDYEKVVFTQSQSTVTLILNRVKLVNTSGC